MCAFSPSWTTHSQNFRRLLRRWGLTGNLDYLLGGVLPTTLVERSWQDDESDGWGLSVLVDTGAAGRIPGVVVLPSSTLDTYVDQIDVIAYPSLAGLGGTIITGQGVFMFTPEGGYNPVSTLTTTPEPGLFNARNFILPTTAFLGGWNTAFQPPGFNPATFILDGYYNPFIPTGGFAVGYCEIPGGAGTPCPPATNYFSPQGQINNPASPAFFLPKMTRIWSQQQPPLRIPATQAMALQLTVVPSVAYTLLCTFLFHEQNAEAL